MAKYKQVKEKEKGTGKEDGGSVSSLRGDSVRSKSGVEWEEKCVIEFADPKIRFLRFSSSEYYPCGGMEDCEGKFATFEEAKFPGLRDDDEIYDTWTGKRWKLDDFGQEWKEIK